MFYAYWSLRLCKTAFPSDDMRTDHVKTVSLAPNDVISANTEIRAVTCVNVKKLLIYQQIFWKSI